MLRATIAPSKNTARSTIPLVRMLPANPHRPVLSSSVELNPPVYVDPGRNGIASPIAAATEYVTVGVIEPMKKKTDGLPVPDEFELNAN